jgi:uncharacterized protein (DUF1330 family)
MPVYLIAEHRIADAAKFEEYRSAVAPLIARFGGRYLTRGGSHKMLEPGVWSPDRVVIIEFPDMEALQAWYRSPEYEPLIALRRTAAEDMVITIEGV